jgi:hypothetical protein
LIEKLHQIYASEELDRIRGVVSEISEKTLGTLHEIIKGDNGPLGRNGVPALGEYKKETKTVVLYENAFNPNVLFHEIGHSIYHECPEIAELTDREYEKDFFHELEINGAVEFCANAYQLYKTGTISTEEEPDRYRNSGRKIEGKGNLE